MLHLRSYQVIREGDDKCVESFRREGKEELHPALKWDWRGTVGGFSVRRSISGCALFVDLEPRLRKEARTETLSPGRGFKRSALTQKNWGTRAPTPTRDRVHALLATGIRELEVLDGLASSHGASSGSGTTAR